MKCQIQFQEAGLHHPLKRFYGQLGKEKKLADSEQSDSSANEQATDQPDNFSGICPLDAENRRAKDDDKDAKEIEDSDEPQNHIPENPKLGDSI